MQWIEVTTSNSVECAGHFMPLFVRRINSKPDHQFTASVQDVDVSVAASQTFSFATCIQYTL